ncbi:MULTISPECIES: hypothetical protein [unclassified Spirosoma]|uniref:hypothetical protein n=1 Tax=unclassified Spirosoma TaxID=2621999 RepID=UPI00095B724F|nr:MULTISPECIES: hypothetical protein [unclassified Spirosoma]MBN8824454.1 hypothetical protein [Spirosoma sp.]OJW70083.1 MAG: hypothetical protein BGO59_25755 [Spirosoma sp. 48-14]
MQSTFPSKPEKDYQLLQQYLSEHFFNDADYLYDAQPDELIENCFRQYYVFLSGSFVLSDWYALFQQEAYRTLSLRGITQDQTEYKLRSARFINYVQNLMNTLQNEKIDVSSYPARESGEDLAHVSV